MLAYYNAELAYEKTDHNAQIRSDRKQLADEKTLQNADLTSALIDNNNLKITVAQLLRQQVLISQRNYESFQKEKEMKSHGDNDVTTHLEIFNSLLFLQY